jgi:uncharacterized membrane protein
MGEKAKGSPHKTSKATLMFSYLNWMMYVHTKTCTQMFIAALFTIAPK